MNPLYEEFYIYHFTIVNQVVFQGLSGTVLCYMEQGKQTEKNMIKITDVGCPYGSCLFPGVVICSISFYSPSVEDST